MSAVNLGGLFDFFTIKRSELVGNAKRIVQIYLASPEQDPSDPNANKVSDESIPADVWQPYGLASRPPKTGLQALIVRAGATLAAIANRLSDESKIPYGALGEGDVALYSTAGNVVRLNGDGSITAIIPTEAGKNMLVELSGKEAGTFKVVCMANESYIELSEENGFVVNVGDKPVTFRCSSFQVAGSDACFNVGSFKPHAAAMVPFTGGAAMPPSPGLLI